MKNLPEIWNEFVNAGNVDSVCSLYAEDARLLATFASSPIDSRGGIRGYFEGFTARPGAGVQFDEEGALRQQTADHCYLYTGTYSFFHGEGDNKQFFPARYSFLVDEKVILKFFTTTHLSFLIPEIFIPKHSTHHHAQPKGNLRYLLFGSPQGSS